MTHTGCFWDNPEDVAFAYGKARGLRLVLASARDDGDAGQAVLDEIGDCAQCLRNITVFLASSAASLGIGWADSSGAGEAVAFRTWESQLAEARSALPPGAV